MFFFYEIDEKKFVDKDFLNIDDPSAKGEKGVNLVISQKYVALRLPAVPASGKIIKYYSLATGIEIPKEKWTPQMHSNAEEARRNIKGSWKLWSWMILLVAVISSFVILGNIVGAVREKKQGDIVKLRNNLKSNDILHIMCYIDPSGMNATVAKVTRVSGDTLFIKVSEERVVLESFDFEEAIKKIDKSEAVYTSDEMAVYYPALKEGKFVFINRANELILSNVVLKNVERKE